MNGTVLSEVPAELQPLFDALHDLRPHFDLNEFAADPGLLDTLGLALNDAQGFLARLQGTRRGAGAGLDESLAPLLDVLSMTENILARFEDGVLRDFAPGEHFDGFERESGFSLERRRALLFLMLMLNNRDGHAEKAKFQQNGFGYATGQDERVSTGKAWSLSAR